MVKRRLLPLLLLIVLALVAGSASVSAGDPSYYYGRRGAGEAEPVPVGYGDTALTFTAGMGSRTAPGPFAAAPIVQGAADGKGTPDVLSFSRGSQISGNWYEKFDWSQGSISFWVTPEWDGDDGVTHYLVYTGATSTLRAYKSSSNYLFVYVGGQGNAVDVSGWTAGTTYHVVVRWDSQNAIDGTNYVCISIDDSHDFGASTPLSIALSDSTLYIGSSGTPSGPANALIEGLTIYRRVLFDGTYGISLGNGDEIALIYAGADPTLITGAWDVVFALPTDSTPAKWSASELGEAWSFPHSSNVITPADGFFVAGMGNWADYGTPTASGTLTATERIFLGGAYVETDAADEGISINVDSLTPGADYALRGIASAVSGDPDIDVEIYDVTNATSITNITDTTTGTRTAPNVLGPISFELPASCTEIQIRVTDADGTSGNQFAVHQAEVYPVLWTDPGMETGTAVTNIGTPSTSAQDAGQAHSGSNSWKVIADATDEGIERALSTTSGKFYALGGWVYADTSGTVDLDTPNFQDGGTTVNTTSGNDAWALWQMVGRASAATMDLEFYSNAAQTFYMDDVTAIEVDSVALTVTAASEANSAEGGGVRFDGYDSGYQTVSGGQLGFDSGWYRWTGTPRHAAADAVKFGNSNAYIAEFYGDANDYIRVYWSSANTITLDVTDAGDSDTGTWDASGAIAAGTDYLMEVQYYPWGAVFRVDGVDMVTVYDSVFFGTKPTAWYLAGAQAGGSSGDMVISAP